MDQQLQGQRLQQPQPATPQEARVNLAFGVLANHHVEDGDGGEGGKVAALRSAAAETIADFLRAGAAFDEAWKTAAKA